MSKISDERREVAATLRDAKRKCDGRGYPWMTDDLCLAIGYEHDYEADNGIFDRLADLIDPTCKNKYRNHDDRSFLCSKCGYEAWTYGDSFCDPDEFRFCPHCGARVVER